MAWKGGPGGKKYYWRTRRVGDRFVTEYYGRGPHAELAAQMDIAERSERRAAAKAARDVQAVFDSVDQCLDVFGRSTDLLASAILHEAGYRQHARGEWRRRQDAKTKGHQGRRRRTNP